jgi:hypothetical protein
MNSDEVPYYALSQVEAVDNDPAGPFMIGDGLVLVIGGPLGGHCLPLFTSSEHAETYAIAMERPYSVPMRFRNWAEFETFLQRQDADDVAWIEINRRADGSYDKRILLRDMLRDVHGRQV